jgi:hypothetical protein
MESCTLNPRTFQVRQAELFEQGLPPNVPIVEKFSAMHFQIDEPESSEHICLSVVVSFPPQSFRETGCDYPEALASALLGLDESVV